MTRFLNKFTTLSLSRFAAAPRSSLLSPSRCMYSTNTPSLVVDNPYTGEKLLDLPWTSWTQTQETLKKSHAAQQEWKRQPLDKRIQHLEAIANLFKARMQSVASEVSQQMGKPVGQSQGEVKGMLARIKAIIEMAPAQLAEDALPDEPGLMRKITKEPVGVVLVIAPWNYPLMTAINAIAPALLCGNSVIIKHSERTPLCGDTFANICKEAGLPANLVTSIHTPHDVTAKLIQDPKVSFVSFTGSVAGGRSVFSTLATSRFIDATLELGGKDPAYVAQDSNLEKAVDGIVDGALYNAGQSCCAVERVYAHASLHDKFVEGVHAMVKTYKLSDPFAEGTSMGPMAQPNQIAFLEAQVADAVSKGAKLVFGGKKVAGKARFFQPTVLTNCTHDMNVMKEETFGPIIPIMKVADDDQALALMNDSAYGLTASVWTTNTERAMRMGKELQCGTVFMNRCDYLDPYLPWSGVKDTGKGVSLSKYGFRSFYRLKGYNFRHGN